jgi:hypothetical protein
MMQGQGSARLWENRDQDDKKRKRIEQPKPTHKPRGVVGTSNAARAMGGGGAGAGAGGTTATKWGQGPAGGWTREQKQNSGRKKIAGRKSAKRVMGGCTKEWKERELEEIKRNPRVASKKIEKQIQRMGVVSPDRDLVDKMAAKAIAYRKQMGMKEGDELLQDKAMNKAVRAQVEEYEARKSKGGATIGID